MALSNPEAARKADVDYSLRSLTTPAVGLYHADIAEHPARNGNFTATLRGSPITATGPDPERDICFAMVSAGLPDGEIQFWRNGSTPSLRYKSVHRTAGYRIGMGETFPYALFKRREVSPEYRARMASKPGALVTQNRETPLAGTSGHPTLPPVPEKISPARESRL